MATELLINIVSQATGKGFLESEKAVNKLEKKVKSLGKTLGVSLAAGAALKFSKTFIKAFAEDEKAAVRLNRAVENLGIGFANPSITKFIADLERTSAIADDVLRPAFQNLLSTTGSLTKSQELLNKAITISRGTGIDLGTVTDDLTKAYVGQTKGLSKYKTGLTAAELATKSFAEIVGIILTANLGAAEDYLDTTAFKMDVLSLATGNAQEIIGSGLVDALGSFAGSGEASDAQFVIEQLSTGFANLLKGAGAALGFLARLPEFGFTAVGLGAMYERPKPKPKTEDAFTIRQKQLLAKLEKASIDRAKKLADLANKQAKAEALKTKEKQFQLGLDKAALALGKGEDVFDLDRIQVQAALLAKQEELKKLGVNATDQQKLQIANDLTRLSIKQTMAQLEDAIAVAQAATTDKEKELAMIEVQRLAKKLNMDLEILGVMQKQEFKLKDIEKIYDKFMPKSLIDLKNLQDALDLLLKMAGLKITPFVPGPIIGGGNGGGGGGGDLFIGNPFNPGSKLISTKKIADEIDTLTSLRLATSTGTGINVLLKEHIDTLTDAISTNDLNALGDEQARLRAMGAFDTPGIGAGSSFDPASFRMADNITVNVNAGVVGSEDTISLAVQRAILDLERKGDPLRYTGGL